METQGDQSVQGVRIVMGRLMGLEGLRFVFATSSSPTNENHQIGLGSSAILPIDASNDNNRPYPMCNILDQNGRDFSGEDNGFRQHRFAPVLLASMHASRNQANVNRVISGINRYHSSKRTNNQKACNFCMSNGEGPEFARSHNLREIGPSGRLILSCPVLRSYVCELCGATGDLAHTRTYCPIVVAQNGGIRPEPLAKLLEQTPHMSCGRRRKNFAIKN